MLTDIALFSSTHWTRSLSSHSSILTVYALFTLHTLYTRLAVTFHQFLLANSTREGMHEGTKDSHRLLRSCSTCPC